MDAEDKDSDRAETLQEKLSKPLDELIPPSSSRKNTKGGPKGHQEEPQQVTLEPNTSMANTSKRAGSNFRVWRADASSGYFDEDQMDF